jgi:Cu/Ag efflux protein CusF
MKIPSFLLLPLSVLAFASCTSITGETETIVKVEQGVPGAEVIETTTFEATVTGIDTEKRKVTVVSKKGKKLNFVAGPEVLNFEQIQIGDQLKVSLTEEFSVRMAKPGEKVTDELVETVELPKIGAKPGLRTSETVQSSAVISEIDTKKRKVALTFGDGSTEKYPVRDDLDLTKRKVGERVVIRSNEIYEISLAKP